jgi:two-component system, LytTR family, response regulator
MSYTAFIIDDEQTCIDNLQNSLTAIPEIELLSSSTMPESGIELLIEKQPDILFLDVEMPQMTGFDLLRSIQDKIDWPLHVVFYTAYDKYLLDAIRTSAFDYLLKPYQPHEFEVVIDRLFTHITQEHQQLDIQTALNQALPSNKTFMVGTATGFRILKTNRVVYFEYQKQNKCWRVNTVDGDNYLLKRITKGDDVIRFFDTFLRINQYQIINLDYLSAINGKECLLVLPFEGQITFKISRKFYKDLQKNMPVL